MSDTTMTASPSSFRVGAVLGRSFELLFRDFAKFFLLTLLAWSPLLLITLVTLGGIRQPGGAQIVALLAGVLFWLIFSVLGQAVILYGAFQQMAGSSFAIGESLSRGLARFFPVIGLMLCMGIGILFGLVLLIVPGMILYVMWSVALPVCVVEQQGPFASLSRSSELTKGYRWKIFGIVILISIVNQIIQKVVQLVLIALGGVYLSALGTFLWMALAGTFTAIAVAVIYHDLRVAKEGIDVDRIIAVFD
jgi:hypothetical protein